MATAFVLLSAGCATGPQERRLEARGMLDLREAGRSEVSVVRDSWGFTVDPARKPEPVLGGDMTGLEPGVVLLGVPGFLALQVAALANGAVIATAVDAAQGGYEGGEKTVRLAAAGSAVDVAVVEAVVARLNQATPGNVARGKDRVFAPPARVRPGEPELRPMPPVAAAGRPVRVQVRTLFQGLQRRKPVGLAEGSDVLESSAPLALVVAVQVLATVVDDESDGQREGFVGGVTVHYESPSRMMGTWSANGAKLLRDELALARTEVVAQVEARLRLAARTQ